MGIATGSAIDMTASAPSSPDRHVVLAVNGVSKHFGVQGASIAALVDVSLQVRQGEIISVIGPSGCGKSTLFNIIGGLLTDYEGEVRIDGERVSGCHADIGMVFQEESTFLGAADENVEFPLKCWACWRRSGASGRNSFLPWSACANSRITIPVNSRVE